MPLLWDSLQIQLQAVPFCLFATPVCESFKKPYTVGIAVRCEPRRGSSATPPLIPASKISWRMPVDLDAYFFCAHLRPKPPKLRFNAIDRIGSLPCRQNRNNGRNLGSQRATFISYHFVFFFYRFALQLLKAALGIGQTVFPYHAIEHQQHICFP